jgi:predicted alpha/beta superfamily hydrolase
MVVAGWVACAMAQTPASQGLRPMQVVNFERSQTTTVGQSLFVVGSIPELGNWDVTRAIKLSPSGYPNWRASIALPAGVSYQYRFVVRSDGPGQTSQASNATFVTSNIAGSTTAVGMAVSRKVLVLSWNVASPVMHVRAAGSTGGFTQVAMQPLSHGFANRPANLPAVVAPAVNAARPADGLWVASGFSNPGESFEFFFTGSDGVSARYPSAGQYTTNLDGAWVQDGQLYTYQPAALPAAARRDYNPASVPTINMPLLGGTRGYRVFLPRGYDQHVQRRYPVIYFHDGQNVFESGAFGSWNAASALAGEQATGRMREVIAVGIDNGPNRLTDYLPPTDILTGVGRGDAYLSDIRDRIKPLIDSTYRTMPEASVTGLIGSSMGGVISLYGVWDFTNTFTRGGLLSGAWQTCPNYLNRVRTTPPRAGVRMWLDSGDSGTANDGYWNTLNLRDSLIAPSASQPVSPYALNMQVQHTVGYGQQHNEAAWTLRLPGVLRFLYPSQEEANGVLREVYSPAWDVNGDVVIGADDLSSLVQQPVDVNFDQVVDERDVRGLEVHLRRDEAASMSVRQR